MSLIGRTVQPASNLIEENVFCWFLFVYIFHMVNTAAVDLMLKESDWYWLLIDNIRCFTLNNQFALMLIDTKLTAFANSS